MRGMVGEDARTAGSAEGEQGFEHDGVEIDRAGRRAVLAQSKFDSYMISY